MLYTRGQEMELSEVLHRCGQVSGMHPHVQSVLHRCGALCLVCLNDSG